MERDGAAIKSRGFNINKIRIDKYMNYKTAIFMAIGFLLSRFTIVYEISPFGIAFFLFFIKLDYYKGRYLIDSAYEFIDIMNKAK